MKYFCSKNACLTYATNTIKHNNGPHQDQVFDNPTALCLALGKRKSDSALVGTDAPNRLFMKGVGTSFYPPDLFRSSRPKYKASTISYFYFCLTYIYTCCSEIAGLPNSHNSLETVLPMPRNSSVANDWPAISRNGQ